MHKKSPSERESNAMPDSPNGSAGGRFIEWCRVFGTTPLTCTIFDPSIFGNSQRNQVYHISPTRPKWPHMGNYLDTFLKMAHRGKRMLLCVSVKLICAFFSLFSVLALWHNGNLPPSRLFPTEIFEPWKNDLQSLLFRVNITHHGGGFSTLVACILQEHP